MVRSMIEAEVAEIAGLADCLDGENGVVDLPEGFGEIPVDIQKRMAGEVKQLQGMYTAGQIDGNELLEGMRCAAKLSFLMGCRFGKLQIAAGPQKVAKVVKMTKGVLVSCLMVSVFWTSFGVGF